MMRTFAPSRLRPKLVLALIVLTLAACSNESSDQNHAGPPPAPVVVAKAAMKNVPLQVQAIGAVSTIATVTIRSQVDGQVESIHFQRGDQVKQGQTLFTIDDGPYKAASDQAKANLSRDEALAANARVDAQRTAGLVKQAAATEYEAEQAQRKYESLLATVKGDAAAVQQARLKLDDCTIKSPITGVAGDLLVNPGDIVKVNDTAMLVINQIKPIYVTFAIPEQYLDPLRKLMARTPLHVSAKVPAAPSTALARLMPPPAAEHGTVTFVDNKVDTATGLISLKATFANADQQLWPGQYVNTTLDVLTIPNAVVVPSQAVQTGQNGAFVYVLKPDQTVAQTPVTTGIEQDGHTVIVKGITAGQTVITDGQLRLRDGAKVTIKPAVTGQTRSATEPTS